MALGIMVETVIRLRFKDVLESLEARGERGEQMAKNFTNNMTENAGSEIQAQINEAETLFSSATSQVNSLNASASGQMGNLATIITNTANPMAASASPSMTITLASNVSGLKGQIDGVNDTLTSLSSVIRKLGVEPPSAVTSLAGSINTVKGLIGAIPV